MSGLYVQSDYWLFGYAVGDTLYGTAAGSATVTGALVPKSASPGASVGSATVEGDIDAIGRPIASSAGSSTT